MTHVLEIAAVCFIDAAGALLTVRKRATVAFMLPGGKLEPAETPRADAANEPDTTLDAHLFLATGQIAPTVPTASGEIDEIRWIPLDGHVGDLPLAPLLVARVLPALRAARDDQTHR